jgi:hypothetical protein
MVWMVQALAAIRGGDASQISTGRAEVISSGLDE